jgi:DNA-binding response OmpR family regulator
MKRILLAEDEEHIAKLVEFKLSRDGFSVHWARNGVDALTLFDQGGWDLVVLDVMMPQMDGWQVLKAMRQERKTSVPILMLTARGNQKDIASAAELGATHFLKKPFDPMELSAWVMKTLNPLTGS